MLHNIDTYREVKIYLICLPSRLQEFEQSEVFNFLHAYMTLIGETIVDIKASNQKYAETRRSRRKATPNYDIYTNSAAICVAEFMVIYFDMGCKIYVPVHRVGCSSPSFPNSYWMNSCPILQGLESGFCCSESQIRGLQNPGMMASTVGGGKIESGWCSFFRELYVLIFGSVR